MLTPEQIADGWKPHDGGPCPVDGQTVVRMLFRNGWINLRRAECEEWPWEPNDPELDIIAYREEPIDAVA
jgi:hypothetical protein